MEKRLLISIFVLLAAAYVQAATISSQSCSVSDVSAALQASKSGDTVKVPAGACNWNSGVTIPSGVILQGAGSSSTVITLNSDIVAFNINSGSRLTGIGIKSSAEMDGTIKIHGTGWRLDHCNIELGISSNGIYVYSPGPGLLDHNNFRECRIVVEGAMSDYDGANALWHGDSPVGTGNAVYIEDNEFRHIHGSSNTIDSAQAARYVARFNTVTDTEFMTHGYQFYGSRGPRSVEIYENKFHSTGEYGGIVPMYLRGGEGVAFNNIITGSWQWSPDILLSHDRSGAVFLPVCDGVSAFSLEVDGSESGQSGWLCRDQIGAGGDLSPSSVSGTWKTDPPKNGMTMVWGKQSRSPFYLWGNTNRARPNTGAKSENHIKANRDYYDGYGYALQTSKNSPFDGTAGVGRGAYANIPATCTPGVAYWATDSGGNWNTINSQSNDGALFKCNSNRQWELKYTPYTYPHPLGGSCTPACSGKQCGDNGCGGTCSPGCSSGQSCVGGNCIDSPQFQPEQVIEAEAGVLSGMQTGTSGADTYVFTASDDTGSATYRFSIQTAGRYRLEARANNKNSGGENSFYVGLDSEQANGNVIYTYNVFPLQAGFFWDNVSRWGNGQSGDPPISEFDPMVWDLTAGTHTFTFYGREANTWLDKIVLKSACLTQSDMMQRVAHWKAGSISLADLMEAISKWKNGC